MTLDISRCLTDLSRRRPVFHSEADFQHALAWKLHQLHPTAAVRLERRFLHKKRPLYVDLWIELDGARIALELKYKTTSFTCEVNGEEFELKKQGAQDTGRYDYLRDVERVETLVGLGLADFGAAVLVTNDQGYWNRASKPTTDDRDFRLHDGRVVGGPLCWRGEFADGTVRGREDPIRLAKNHELSWVDYATVGESKRGRLRALTLLA